MVRLSDFTEEVYAKLRAMSAKHEIYTIVLPMDACERDIVVRRLNEERAVATADLTAWFAVGDELR